MMDGNFQGEHMKMRNPSDDVQLADGKGFFVEDQRYKDHLKASPASAPVRTSKFISFGPYQFVFIEIVIEIYLSRASSCELRKYISK